MMYLRTSLSLPLAALGLVGVVGVIALGAPATAHAGEPCAAPAPPIIEHYRTAESSLREHAWAEMAEFFATAAIGAEPSAQEDPATTAATLPHAEALLELPAPRRPAIVALAAPGLVDRLSDTGHRERERALRGLETPAIVALLDSDDPTLRANTWWWLASSRRGACVLPEIGDARLLSALSDRSRVVEQGDDLLFRRVGDYALAALLRRLADDPNAVDDLLLGLVDGEPDRPLPPYSRALAASLLIQRGASDERARVWLGDDDPALRLAVALALVDRAAATWGAELVAIAADDPDDLVTQGIVDRLLDHRQGQRRPPPLPALDGPVSPRLAEAALRWRGEGDPTAPLPSARREPVSPTSRGYAGLLAAR